jgi:hypothetical protein
LRGGSRRGRSEDEIGRGEGRENQEGSSGEGGGEEEEWKVRRSKL